MKERGTDHKGTHPDDLLVSYLEDVLPGKDRDMVQEHLNSCEECSQEFQRLRQTIEWLSSHKEAMCPEPHHLHEFALSGSDLSGNLVRHLDECDLCRGDVAAYQIACEKAALPQRVRKTFLETYPQAVPSPRDSGAFTSLLAKVLSWFRLPVTALAAAAAVLLVVMIFPWGSSQPYLGLSSVSWEDGEGELIPKYGAPGSQKTRVAIVIVFKGFGTPPSQRKIDALYEALRPLSDAPSRFSVVSPAEVKTDLAQWKKQANDTMGLSKSLEKDLGISHVIILEISQESGSYSISAEAADPMKQTLSKGPRVSTVGEKDLSDKVREMASAMMR